MMRSPVGGGNADLSISGSGNFAHYLVAVSAQVASAAIKRAAGSFHGNCLFGAGQGEIVLSIGCVDFVAGSAVVGGNINNAFY